MVACGRGGQEKIGKPMKNMLRVVLKRFQLAKIKFIRNGEGGREALRARNCSINI